MMMWHIVLHRLTGIELQLIRIERQIGALTKQEGTYEMATQTTLDRLTADVAKNTDAAAAAAAALNGFIATVADLTAKLQAAIESGDEAAISAAADALEANNASLTAATPAVAAAVKANT